MCSRDPTHREEERLSPARSCGVRASPQLIIKAMICQASKHIAGQLERKIWDIRQVIILTIKRTKAISLIGTALRKHLRHEYGQIWIGLINGIILL
jgi:hypothetical protein